MKKKFRESYPMKKTISGRKRACSLTKGQRILVVIVVILSIITGLVFIYKSLFVKPDLTEKTDELNQQDVSPNKIDWGNGIQPQIDGTRKSDEYYTVLVLGRDTGGGGNTDTMLLASYDVANQKATVMSIPRDTMVNVSWDVKKINSVYNNYGGGQDGIQGLYKEISQLVGFQPDYQIVIEWDAVGKIVDAIGGVYFDVPYNMDYHDPVQNLVIEQEKGYRLLNGEDAMQVIRWRKNDKTSPYGYHNGIGDSGRMKVQQDFLKAVIEQMLKPENVLNIGKIVQVFQESVETDLSFQNMLWFGKQAASGGLSSNNITFLTMPWKSAEAWSYYYHTYLDYVVPIPDELLNIVNNQLSPFVNEFTLSDLDIMSVNADGSLHSTTGHLEDSRASKPVSVSSGTQDSKGENSNSIESEANLPSNDSASQSPSNSDTLPVDPNESTTSDSNSSPTIPDDNEESKPDESPDESPKDTMDEAGETLPSTSGDSSFSIISPAPIS